MEYFLSCKVCNSKIDIINKKFKLVKCRNCKLIFSEKIFSTKQFIDTYNNLYNNTLQYNVHQKQYEKLLKGSKINIGRTKIKVLKKIFKSKIYNICEIGAGVGIVSNFLKNKKVDYVGFELDEKTSEKAQQLGFNIQNGDFSQIETFKNEFDSIIAFEVIEHLQDLNLFFELVLKKLSPKGLLGFTVPNYNKYLNYSNPNERIYQSGPPIHLNFFNNESIIELSKFYGFKIVLYKEKRFPYMNIMNLNTYKFIIKSIFGRYHGSTIMCVFEKI